MQKNITFQSRPINWQNAGELIAPEKLLEGYAEWEQPQAGTFNQLMHVINKCIDELQKTVLLVNNNFLDYTIDTDDTLQELKNSINAILLLIDALPPAYDDTDIRAILVGLDAQLQKTFVNVTFANNTLTFEAVDGTVSQVDLTDLSVDLSSINQALTDLSTTVTQNKTATDLANDNIQKSIVELFKLIDDLPLSGYDDDDIKKAIAELKTFENTVNSQLYYITDDIARLFTRNIAFNDTIVAMQTQLDALPSFLYDDTLISKTIQDVKDEVTHIGEMFVYMQDNFNYMYGELDDLDTAFRTQSANTLTSLRNLQTQIDNLPTSSENPHIGLPTDTVGTPTLFGKIDIANKSLGADDEFYFKAVYKRFTDVTYIPLIGSACEQMFVDDYCIFILSVTNTTLYVLDKRDMTIKSVVIGEIKSQSQLWADETHVFITTGGNTANGKVFKYNIVNLSLSATFTALNSHPTHSIAGDNTFIYVSTYLNKQVLKILKNDMSLIATSPIMSSYVFSLQVDINYLYVPLSEARQVAKLDKADMSLIATSPLAVGGIMQQSTQDLDYIYVSTISAGTIVKFDKKTLAIVGYTTKLANSAQARELVCDDASIFMVTRLPSSLHVYDKITLKTDVVLSNAQSTRNLSNICIDDKSVYFCTQYPLVLTILSKDYQKSHYQKLPY